MASVMKQMAQRATQHIVKTSTPEAWETTATLRHQYIATSMDAMPARAAAASKEWAAIREKITSREVTVNDLTTGIVRGFELYAFYFMGKTIGGRSLPVF